MRVVVDPCRGRSDSFDAPPLPRRYVRVQDAAGVILYAAEAATQVALDAIQCLGGNGYINDYNTGRILRDAKL